MTTTAVRSTGPKTKASARLALAPTRDELVDALMLFAAITLGLVGFRTTYGGSGYLVVGLSALVLGIALGHVTTRLGQPVVAVAAVSLVAFFALGGALTQPETTIGGVVPTLGTVRALVDGSVNGWIRLLTTLPPVGNTSHLLTIPYLVGLAAGVAGYLTARRTGSALAVLVVPVSVLVLSILFGTEQPAALLLQGGVFGVLALGWFALRHQRTRPVVQEGVRSRTRILTAIGMLGVAAVASGLVAPHLPFAHSHSRVVLRDYAQPPFDPSSYPSPLAGFRSYVLPKGLKDKTLLIVKGLPQGARLRFATMDVYDGVVWGVGGAAGAGDTSGLFRRVGVTIPPTSTGQRIRIQVQVEQYSGVWLPDAGDVVNVTFAGPHKAALTDSFRYNLTTGTAVASALLGSGDTYTLDVLLPAQPSKAVLAGAAADGSPMPMTDLPHLLTVKVKDWTGSAVGAHAALSAVASQLKSGGYSNGTQGAIPVHPGHGQGRLDEFLSVPTASQLVGDDEQYAATFALAANAMGYPARVVLGATPETTGLVKGSDVHAWVEVHLTGAGWVPFDVTPTRPAAAQPPKAPVGDRSAAQVPPPVSLPPPGQSIRSDVASTASDSAANRRVPPHFAIPHLLVVLAAWAGPPLAALLLLVGGIVGTKAWRRRRRRLIGPASSRIAGGWRELVDQARDLGLPAVHLGTRREQARLIAHPELVPMAHRADAALFGPAEPAAAEAEAYWTQVEGASRALLTEVGRWRRLLAWANPASLLGSRRRAGRPQTGTATA